MENIDFSLPLATLLRESTHEAHELVAKSPGATTLLSGRLDRELYVRYLMMLWHVYNTLEQALDRHSAHPNLEPTYNPTLLARAPALAADISYLLEIPEPLWQLHPAHVQLLTAMPLPLTTYITRIQELADSADPTPLLAHSYVRYLGDLSGGQTIRRTLGKAYELDEAIGLGLAFYSFKGLRSSKSANQGEMKRIKEWFREGVNAAGSRSIEVKASVLNEADSAFDLNRALFSTIQAGPEDAQVEDKAIPRVINRPLEERSYPLHQVVAVIIAVCLAHFIVVTGGLTGNRGYQKLLTLERWLETFWESASRTE